MAKAKKLPSGAWRTQANKTINGKLIRKSFTVSPEEFSGMSLKEASKMAKSKSELLAREWTIEADVSKSNITVSKAIELYIQDRSAVLSPSTIADYKRMPKYFDDISNMAAQSVDTRTIQALINDMAMPKDNKTINARTIKNRIFFLLAALNYVGVDKKFKLRFPSQIKPNLAPPETNEFHRLLELATPEEKLILVLAGLYTLRRGEIAGLCGEDVLWDMNSIYVHTSRVQDENKQWVRRQMPKNLNSVRTIRIDEEILTALFPHKEPGEYLISLNPNQITKHFERLRNKAGVSCRFHDLRKYAASMRAELIPLRYVEADGGWRENSTIMRETYNKPFKEARKTYSKQVNDHIKNEFGNELLG